MVLDDRGVIVEKGRGQFGVAILAIVFVGSWLWHLYEGNRLFYQTVVVAANWHDEWKAGKIEMPMVPVIGEFISDWAPGTYEHRKGQDLAVVPRVWTSVTAAIDWTDDELDDMARANKIFCRGVGNLSEQRGGMRPTMEEIEEWFPRATEEHIRDKGYLPGARPGMPSFLTKECLDWEFDKQ